MWLTSANILPLPMLSKRLLLEGGLEEAAPFLRAEKGGYHQTENQTTKMSLPGHKWHKREY